MHKALGAKGFVRSQDIMRWLVMYLRNHRTRQVAWQYLKDEWTWFYKTLGESKSFDYLPTYCASIVTIKQEYDNYIEFFEPKKLIKVMERNIIIGEADAAARVAWRKRDEKPILDWLKKNS